MIHPVKIVFGQCDYINYTSVSLIVCRSDFTMFCTMLRVQNNIDDFFEDFTQSQTALKRLPKGSEVGEMVVFLASSKASAITGQCINVDCGVFPQ